MMRMLKTRRVRWEGYLAQIRRVMQNGKGRREGTIRKTESEMDVRCKVS
jgi:hypothetical protein